MAPAADNASAMAATGMISARIMELLFQMSTRSRRPSVLINLIRASSAPRAKETPLRVWRADIRPDFDWDKQRVGWVERSNTHQLLFMALMGFAKGSTHPTC